MGWHHIKLFGLRICVWRQTSSYFWQYSVVAGIMKNVFPMFDDLHAHLVMFWSRHGPPPHPLPAPPADCQHAGLSVSRGQRAVWVAEADRGTSSSSASSTSSSGSSTSCQRRSVWDGNCRWEVFSWGKADGAQPIGQLSLQGMWALKICI